MPKIAVLIVIGLLFLLYYLFFYSPYTTIDLTIKSKTFTLEIARTPIQKSRGLMRRSSLCPTCGMIFVFAQESIYPFWMKNTPLPLDIIWLDQNGTVVDIKTGQPQNTTLLTNTTKAKYVIETNLDATGLKIGDQVKI